MALLFNDTKVWSVKYNDADVTEIELDNGFAWKGPLVFTLGDNDTYSVKARRLTKTGSGISAGMSTGSGYPCTITIPISNKDIDLQSSGLGIVITEVVGLADGASVTVDTASSAVVITGHASMASKWCSATIEITDLPETLVIPSQFNGKVVDKIDEGGFNNCPQLKRLSIPASVYYMGDTGVVLKGTKNLVSISLDAAISVNKLYKLFDEGSSYKFYNSAEKLEEIVLINGSVKPGFVGTPPAKNCRVYISKTIKYADSYAFGGLDYQNHSIWCEHDSAPSGFADTWNMIIKNQVNYQIPTVYSVPLPTYVTG